MSDAADRLEVIAGWIRLAEGDWGDAEALLRNAAELVRACERWSGAKYGSSYQGSSEVHIRKAVAKQNNE